MSKFMNLTPHEIVIRVGDVDCKIPPSGMVARVVELEPEIYPVSECPVIDGVVIPCIAPVQYGEVEGLPDRSGNLIYIVSAMVLARVRRSDVFAPDTGKTAIRNEKGHIVAVTRLICSR